MCIEAFFCVRIFSLLRLCVCRFLFFIKTILFFISFSLCVSCFCCWILPWLLLMPLLFAWRSSSPCMCPVPLSYSTPFSFDPFISSSHFFFIYSLSVSHFLHSGFLSARRCILFSKQVAASYSYFSFLILSFVHSAHNDTEQWDYALDVLNVVRTV